jgi:hypothetical protein
MANIKTKKVVKLTFALFIALFLVSFICAIASGNHDTHSSAYNSGRITGFTVVHVMKVLVHF